MTEITVPFDHPDYWRQRVAYLKSRLPPGDPDLMSLSDMAREQGKGPITLETLQEMGNSGLALYEGFEEDVTRMRRGLEPIGPRK